MHFNGDQQITVCVCFLVRVIPHTPPVVLFCVLLCCVIENKVQDPAL